MLTNKVIDKEFIINFNKNISTKNADCKSKDEFIEALTRLIVKKIIFRTDIKIL